MRFPFVSRDRYDEAVGREAKLEIRIQDLENKMLDLVDRVVEIKVDGPPIARPPADPNSFALPDIVSEAIQARAPKGSRLAATLRSFAEGRLANGETGAEDVAAAIIAGAELPDEEW